MKIPRIQWVELDPDYESWQSLEGRFYIHANGAGYALEVREIRYALPSKGTPHEVRITKLAFSSVAKCKRFAQRWMKDVWNGRYDHPTAK